VLLFPQRAAINSPSHTRVRVILTFYEGIHTVTVPSNRLVPGPENIFQLGLRVLFLSKCLARGTVKYLEKKIEFWKQKLKIIVAKKYV